MPLRPPACVLSSDSSQWIFPDTARRGFDLAVPTLRWAIEVDVFPTHAETEGRRRDLRRDEAAKAIGWDTTRIVEADLAESMSATVARLRGDFDRRGLAS